jgi:peroxiredoxin Q/BCP
VTSGNFPNIYLSSTSQKTISIAQVALESNVIVFFYPGDNEGLRYAELMGCTPEACHFKDTIEFFNSKNTVVFGVSFQSSDRQSAFQIANHLNFDLLSDSNKQLVKRLAMPYWKSSLGEEFPFRQTYIIKKGNQIAKLFSEVNPDTHINEVIAEINKLTMKHLPR